jgi:hypothetical protein
MVIWKRWLEKPLGFGEPALSATPSLRPPTAVAVNSDKWDIADKAVPPWELWTVRGVSYMCVVLALWVPTSVIAWRTGRTLVYSDARGIGAFLPATPIAGNGSLWIGVVGLIIFLVGQYIAAHALRRISQRVIAPSPAWKQRAQLFGQFMGALVIAYACSAGMIFLYSSLSITASIVLPGAIVLILSILLKLILAKSPRVAP